MPYTTLATARGVEYPVIQGAYNWFVMPPAQRTDRTESECYVSATFTCQVEPQLDLFPELLSVQDYFLFKWLVEQWHLERGATSSTSEMVLCPAYQRIIGMGQGAITLILSELESESDNPDHWFWALQALTGVNPVPEEHEGNLRRMSIDWLQWARRQGYAW